MLKSGIKDKNGVEVKVGDIIAIPYTTPFGELTNEIDERHEVVFARGCFGYFDETDFVPLFMWERAEEGEYIPNQGNRMIYTGEHMFWVIKE